MKEKTYQFDTIDQDGAIETHEIKAFNMQEAKKYRAEFIGTSRSGQEKHGRITLKNQD